MPYFGTPKVICFWNLKFLERVSHTFPPFAFNLCNQHFTAEHFFKSLTTEMSLFTTTLAHVYITDLAQHSTAEMKQSGINQLLFHGEINHSCRCTCMLISMCSICRNGTCCTSLITIIKLMLVCNLGIVILW